MLSEAENAKRLRGTVQQMRAATASKVAASRYYEKNGTLQGWEGRLLTAADFAGGDPEPAQPQRTGRGAPPSRRTEAVRVTSQEEFNALPSGTRFVAPDGSTRVKP
jgi:hypothetical protein